MQDVKSDKTHRGHTLIRAFGIMALILLVLVSIAGAASFAYITNSRAIPSL